MKKKVINFILLLLLPFIVLLALLIPKKKRKYIWGTTPLVNNKYWSKALQEMGLDSITLMEGFYSIQKKCDYDLYFHELLPVYLKKIHYLKNIFAFFYILRHAKVFHTCFEGGPLGRTILWRLEIKLLKFFKIKIVVLPYGADAYMYSRVLDKSLQNGLLASYPHASSKEPLIQKKVFFFTKNADFTCGGFMSLDGFSRWDTVIHQFVVIDTKLWQCKRQYSDSDGINDSVKIIHTPNHRGFKGTEFLLKAIENLKKKGLKIELILLEKIPNDKVRDYMQEADILAEQFIAIGYALSAIEGMASGLVTLSNLSDDRYTRIFRRYSFLNECPIVSTPPEMLERNIEVLVRNPQLRKELGLLGRSYVEKYHSYKTSQYLFTNVYDKILYNKDVDLMNLFHPLLSEYNKCSPVINVPLEENKIPKRYFKQQF